MHKDRLPNRILDDWSIDAKVAPHPVDKDGLDVRGLKIEGLLNDTNEIVARTVHFVSEEMNIENTEERAARLRVLVADVLGRCLSLGGELLDDVELVLAELIQNAQRYSISGPIWVSIVQTVLSRSDKPECVLDVTVVNDKKADPIPYLYPDDDIPTDDGASDISVHGRGSIIVEALSFQHGSFKVDRLVGAYALMHCNANHEVDDDYKEVA